MELILFYFYRYVLAPLGVSLFFLFAPFNKKLRESLKLRNSHRQRPHLKKSPVWIHASSGEFEYAKSVIRQLKEEHPDTPVLVTYFSPSYVKQIQNFPGVDRSEPLPLDLPQAVHSFLKHYKPCALLVARTDLWPETLLACRQKNIPVLLFATTFRPLTGLRKLLTPFFRLLFRHAQDVFCVSRFDVDNLKTICPSSAMGDPRYDQVEFRLTHPKNIKDIFTAQSDKLTLVCGSTWSQDEGVVLPAVTSFIKEQKLRVILAPHEPSNSHSKSLIQYFSNHNVEVDLYSTCEKWKSDVLIIDEVGILADLYKLGDIAFVGGSFRQKVHSVMEPLGSGCPVLVGPYYQNNREATEFSKMRSPWGNPAVAACENQTELTEVLKYYVHKKNDISEAKNWIRLEFTKRLHATDSIIQWLKPFLR